LFKGNSTQKYTQIKTDKGRAAQIKVGVGKRVLGASPRTSSPYTPSPLLHLCLWEPSASKLQARMAKLSMEKTNTESIH
jgi:hypothetical protein